jgi:hypothetical protein
MWHQGWYKQQACRPQLHARNVAEWQQERNSHSLQASHTASAISMHILEMASSKCRGQIATWFPRCKNALQHAPGVPESEHEDKGGTGRRPEGQSCTPTGS